MGPEEENIRYVDTEGELHMGKQSGADWTATGSKTVQPLYLRRRGELQKRK